jgi:recombination protein RecA
LSTIAQAQRQGGLCAFIDAEHAMDMQYAKRLGVVAEDLLISQPDYGEQALEIVDQLCQSQAVALIVVDSVAALVPKAELEGEIGDVHMGLQARLMSQAMRKLAAVSARHDTTVLFINQLRHKIGVQFGSPETTPGGNALKFYASVRLDIRRIGQVKIDGEEADGTRVRVKVVKNKLAPPFRKAEFEVLFGSGVNTGGELVDLGVERGFVKKSGVWYSCGEQRLGQGRGNAVVYLAEHPDLAEELRQAILASATAPAPAPAVQALECEDEESAQPQAGSGR